mgnify:CR=1 FL=1
MKPQVYFVGGQWEAAILLTKRSEPIVWAERFDTKAQAFGVAKAMIRGRQLEAHVGGKA